MTNEKRNVNKDKERCWNVFNKTFSKEHIELWVSEDLKNASPQEIEGCIKNMLASIIGVDNPEHACRHLPIGVGKLEEVFQELRLLSIDRWEIEVEMAEKMLQLYEEELGIRENHRPRRYRPEEYMER